MACPPAKNFSASANYIQNNVKSLDQARASIAKSINDQASAYCLTGGPKCKVMGNGSVIAWNVQIGQKGSRTLTVTMEMNCGEPAPPTWRIIFDAVADGLGIFAVASIAVGIVITYAPAVAALVAADPEAAEELKKFTEELVKLRQL